jgi:hypothetical protein
MAAGDVTSEEIADVFVGRDVMLGRELSELVLFLPVLAFETIKKGRQGKNTYRHGTETLLRVSFVVFLGFK